MLKKIMGAAVAAAALLNSLTAFAALDSVITNNAAHAPDRQVTEIFKSGANNPDEATRYEGVPNLLMVGDRYGASYLNLGGGNYCTQIESADNTQCWISFGGTSYSTGIYIIEMDIAKASLSSATYFQLVGKKADGSGNEVYRVFYMSTNGNIMFDTGINPTDEFNSVKSFSTANPPTKDSWIHIKLMYDLDAKTYDLYINNVLALDDIYKDMQSVSGFRVTQRPASGGAPSYAFVDNYFIGHDAKYNSDLLLDSYACKKDSSAACVRRISILTDRNDLSVQPAEINGSLYLPLRFAADCYNASLSYDEKALAATVGRGENTAVITENSPVLYLNGEAVSMAAPAVNLNGRIFVPVDGAAKALNTNVYYDESGRILLTDYYGVTESDFNLIFARMGE